MAFARVAVSKSCGAGRGLGVTRVRIIVAGVLCWRGSRRGGWTHGGYASRRGNPNVPRAAVARVALSKSCNADGGLGVTHVRATGAVVLCWNTRGCGGWGEGGLARW